MRINQINNICPVSKIAFKSASYALKTNLQTDTFEKQKPKSAPFGIRDAVFSYKITPPLFKNLKYDMLDKECKEAAKGSALAGRMFKEKLDLEFGEGNYVFVSIGTSPSGIAKALEAMGNDVRYIPISGLGKFGGNISELCFNQDTKKFEKYLKQIGLDYQTVNDDNKKYLFYDYTATGKSLKTVKFYATLAGLDSNKTEFRSLNREFANIWKNATPDKKEITEEYAYKFLKGAKIAKYSGIPHLNCTEVNKIEELLNKTPSTIARDFEFALIANLDAKNMLK